MSEESQDLDFNIDNYDSFFYTSDKQIRKMDDEFIMAVISEKYPDLTPDGTDNVIKQAITLFLIDSKHVNRVLDYFDITIHDLFKVMYRAYPFIFNTCFSNKVHDIIKKRPYARRTRTKV